jgi:3-hydroxyisobutyrate dehydrogenase-like beta-hydroxyacid dehydrogenase
MNQKVGMIGLGIMGSALAANLLKSGFEVSGYDVEMEKSRSLAAKGGRMASSSREVSEKTDVIITCLPSNEALHDAVFGKEGVLAGARKGLVLIEASTLTIEAKREVYDALKSVGMEMLDCPLNGTAIHAVRKELAIFASGNRETCKKCQTIFDGFSRKTYYVGEFGMGTKMKFLNNLMVAIHNVAAAEAFVLGMKAGLEPEMIHKVLSDGAGSSRMFEVRGAFMVKGTYDEAMMKLDLFQKDIKIITAFANELHCPTPLLAAATQLYTAAIAKGWSKKDSSAVCAVLEDMAGLERSRK